MSTRMGTPLLAAFVAAFDEADDGAKRQLASRLRPYLADDPGRLLDAGEMAELLSLHPDTLVRMARTGRIWAKKAGREWRFRADRPEIQPCGGTSAVSPASTSPPRRPAAAVPESFAAIRGRP